MRAARSTCCRSANGFAGPGGPPLHAPGRLIRVDANGTQTLIYAGLIYPGGFAIGPDGAAYVTKFGVVLDPIPGPFPDGGQAHHARLTTS